MFRPIAATGVCPQEHETDHRQPQAGQLRSEGEHSEGNIDPKENMSGHRRAERHKGPILR